MIGGAFIVIIANRSSSAIESEGVFFILAAIVGIVLAIALLELLQRAQRARNGDKPPSGGGGASR